MYKNKYNRVSTLNYDKKKCMKKNKKWVKQIKIQSVIDLENIKNDLKKIKNMRLR